MYKGVGSAFVGSAPSGALFFVTYERTKDFVKRQVLGKDFAYADPISHIVAGSLGETAACAARVPTEVVKQRVQASQYKSSIQSFMHIFASKGNHGLLGSIRALYRGGSATLLRDIPFTMIQFPIWEALKTAKQRAQGRSTVTGLESAAFGSVSGAVAAILTTPLDVIKTRTILASERRSMRSTVMMIVQTDGPRALLAGVLPRTIWISAGGAVFLGSYQLILNNLQIR